MVNGKFVDLHGMVHKFIPPDAEILNSTDGKDSKGTTPHNGNNNGSQPQQTTHPSIPQPAEASGSYPTLGNYTYPKCISYEILRAVQTSSMAQVSVRAHCNGKFADAVVHYDFEVYEQLYAVEPEDPDHQNPEIDILKFKQTALKVAHAEAVKIAKKLLCEQKEREN